MPRRDANRITWTDSKSRQLQKAVNNFNAKLKRLTDRDPDRAVLYPDKVSVRSLKRDIDTTEDLNLTLNRLQSFTKRGSENLVTNEKGERFTNYEVDLLKAENELRNERRETLRNELGLDLKKDKFKVNELGLQPRNLNVDNITRRGFDKALEQVEKELLSSYTTNKMEQYKENYLRSIKKELGSEGDTLVELLEDAPPEKLYNALRDDLLNPFIKINFVYSKEKTTDRVDAIQGEWQRILDT